MTDKRDSKGDNLSRHVEKLQGIIHARSDVMDILQAARDRDPPQWVVGGRRFVHPGEQAVPFAGGFGGG